MSGRAQHDDDRFGFSTDIAHYSLDSHVGQSDANLQADVQGIVDDLNRIEALEAEVERLRRVVEVGGGNIRDLWTALRMVRDALEEVGPVGVLPSAEYEGVEPGQVADTLVAGIAAIAVRIPDPDDLRAACSMADAHIDHLVRARMHPDPYAQASRMQVVGAGHNTIARLRATLPTTKEGDTLVESALLNRPPLRPREERIASARERHAQKGEDDGE